MGGIGSGRHGGKPVAEHCMSLDVNHLKRRGCFDGQWSGRWQWSCGGQRSGSIRMRSARDIATLIYRSRTAGGDWEDIEETIRIHWEPCRFGGARPYFLCPAYGCGRRVLKLYGPGKYFLCRHCYGLAYASQNESDLDRAYRRVGKAKAKLGVRHRSDDILVKPKGMHQTTFDRLWEAALEAESIADDEFVFAAARLLARLGHPVFNERLKS